MGLVDLGVGRNLRSSRVDAALLIPPRAWVPRKQRGTGEQDGKPARVTKNTNTVRTGLLRVLYTGLASDVQSS